MEQNWLLWLCLHNSQLDHFLSWTFTIDSKTHLTLLPSMPLENLFMLFHFCIMLFMSLVKRIFALFRCSPMEWPKAILQISTWGMSLLKPFWLCSNSCIVENLKWRIEMKLGPCYSRFFCLQINLVLHTFSKSAASFFWNVSLR